MDKMRGAVISCRFARTYIAMLYTMQPCLLLPAVWVLPSLQTANTTIWQPLRPIPVRTDTDQG